MAIFERPDLEQPPADGTPGFIPTNYALDIVKAAQLSSLAMTTFKSMRIPTKSNSIPVMEAAPTASWVNNEPTMAAPHDGKKSLTDMSWRGAVLTAEVIAAISIVPTEILEDSDVDLWAELVPALAESIGGAVDLAVFGGTAAGGPVSWGAGILADAKAAGNVVAPVDTAADMNDALGQVEADGFAVNRVYASIDQKAAYRGLNAAGIPVFLTSIRDDRDTSTIYGYPVSYDDFGALNSNAADFTSVDAVVGDSTKAVLGYRLDMEVTRLTEATLDLSPSLDGTGPTINLAQSDSTALRVRARFGFVVTNPATRQNPDVNTRYPFSVIGVEV